MGKLGRSAGGVLTGILAALAASSCCIPPLIAAIAGVGGASSSLSWMEPFRPYLIVVSAVAIGYAWYTHFKSKQEDDCGCAIEKPKWYQTKVFLMGITLFAFISVGFPYYSGIFYSNPDKIVVIKDVLSVQKIVVEIDGMTCDACEQHINHAVNGLTGIVAIETSYANGEAEISFDTTQLEVSEIEQSINSTGYQVTKIIEK